MVTINGRMHVVLTIALLVMNIYLVAREGVSSTKLQCRDDRSSDDTPATSAPVPPIVGRRATIARAPPPSPSSSSTSAADESSGADTGIMVQVSNSRGGGPAPNTDKGAPKVEVEVQADARDVKQSDTSEQSPGDARAPASASWVPTLPIPARGEKELFLRTDDNGGHGFLNSVGDVNYVSPPKEKPFFSDFCPPEDRLVSMNVKGSGYGLTNQLLSYAGLFAFAVRDNRTVLIPKARVPLVSIVDLANSHFHPGLRICTRVKNKRSMALMLNVLKRVRPGKGTFQFIDRMAVELKPIKVLQLLDKLRSVSARIPYVAMWEMFLRYPFPGEVNPAVLPNSFICGLAFPNTTTGPFETASSGLQKMCGDDGAYMAAHFRLEADALSMLGERKIPTAAQFFDFLIGPIAKLAVEKGVKCVLICSGDLAPEYEAAAERASAKTGLRYSRKTTFLKEGAIAKDANEGGGVFYGKFVRPTSSVGATVDLLLMEKAKVVVMTAFSSFTLAVYSRRCGGGFGGGGCSNNGNVNVYDVYLDGSFTGIKEYPCGYGMGVFLKGPPHLIAKPPPELTFFDRRFGFFEKSPLFTDPDRNLRKGHVAKVSPPAAEGIKNNNEAASASGDDHRASDGTDTTTSSDKPSKRSGGVAGAEDAPF